MQDVLTLIFIASALLAVVLALVYFWSLLKFSRILCRENSDMLRNVRQEQIFHISNLRASYLVLLGIKNGAFRGIPLSSQAMFASSAARRWLNISAFSIFFLIMLGLWLSVAKA